MTRRQTLPEVVDRKQLCPTSRTWSFAMLTASDAQFTATSAEAGCIGYFGCVLVVSASAVVHYCADRRNRQASPSPSLSLVVSLCFVSLLTKRSMRSQSYTAYNRNKQRTTVTSLLITAEKIGHADFGELFRELFLGQLLNTDLIQFYLNIDLRDASILIILLHHRRACLLFSCLFSTQL